MHSEKNHSATPSENDTSGPSARGFGGLLRYRGLKTAVFLLAVTLVAIGGFIWFYYQGKSDSPFSKELVTSVDFILYYPAAGLPDGYYLDRDSIRYEQGLVLYQVKHETKGTVSVTQQSKPANYDFSTLSDDNKFIVEAGEAIVGVGDGFSSGSIINDTSWILLRTSETVPTSDLETIMKSLRQHY